MNRTCSHRKSNEHNFLSSKLKHRNGTEEIISTVHLPLEG
jgi:hypothetical protein